MFRIRGPVVAVSARSSSVSLCTVGLAMKYSPRRKGCRALHTCWLNLPYSSSFPPDAHDASLNRFDPSSSVSFTTAILSSVAHTHQHNDHFSPPTATFFVRMKRKPITAEENALHKYSTYSPKENHFDHPRHRTDPKDERRLVLSAECQIGKTGAYLHYLSMLTGTVPDPDLELIPSPLPWNTEDGWPKDAFSWLLPHWRTLLRIRPMTSTYGRLLASKYTNGIAMQRVHLVMQSCKGGEWLKNYACGLVNLCGEHVRSEAGRELIQNLASGNLEAPFDAEGNPRQTRACCESLKMAINWDGRFDPRLGVVLCACEGHCTCQDIMAGGASFGRGLKLSMAKLAQTGGEHGCVDARWENPSGVNEGEKSNSCGLLNMNFFCFR